MCGICGFNWENRNLIRSMVSVLIHRGPDDQGSFIDKNISLGHSRLSIIDLTTGHQPIHNETGDIWIIFNGEIYNFIDLRQKLEFKGHNFYTDSDTEVIIHAYEEWGTECVKLLRGQFAFCIYDSSKEILFLSRDPIGIKPLYYYHKDSTFIFGSEIKSILCFNLKRQLNLSALNLYLSLRYIPENITLFQNIYKVPPSSFLVFDLKSKNLSIQNYWNLSFNIQSSNSEFVLARELTELLKESIKMRLLSDVPIGAFLSGGIDSSAVVAIMSQLINEPIKTFSIGFEEGAPVNETRYAKIVSDYFSTDHQELIIKSSCYEIIPELVWHFDDLIADPAIIPVYFMSKLAKEKIKVALTGDGADEIFSGYSVYSQSSKIYDLIPKNIINPLMKLYNYIPSQTIRMGLSHLNLSKSELDKIKRGIILIPDEEKRRMVNFTPKNVSSFLEKRIYKNLDHINQNISWDVNYQLPNQYNMKTDKMSMAASLETRVPFLDTQIINWAAKIPTNLKLKGKTEKYILRLALKDILPPQILKRKKQGFGTPLNLWLKTGMSEFSGEIFDRLIKRKHIFNPSYIKSIKKNRKKRIYEIRVWTLMMFELWYETFFENDLPISPIKI